MGLYFFKTKRDQMHEARLEVNKNHIRTYLDGTLYCDNYVKSPEPEALYYSAVKDEDGKVFVKLVNAEAQEKEVEISFLQKAFGEKVTVHAMEGFDLKQRNSLERPDAVAPETFEVELGEGRGYTLRGNSFAVLCFDEV